MTGQKWRKLGLIYKPPGTGWMMTHAQNPFPMDLGNNRIRVYFATRDSESKSRGGHFDICMEKFSEILDFSQTPDLDLGELGTFDDSGVMPSSIISIENKNYMYYTGWSRTVDVPFAFHIGLAIENEMTGKFERYSKAPILGRNHFDPFITGAPHVMKIDTMLYMWYISGTKWVKETVDSKPVHYYTVKQATSSDGIRWRTNDKICIQYEAGEYAIARPVVFEAKNGFEMWFSYRGGSDTYRIGRAFSKNAIQWERDPNGLQIDVSSSGWDSQMVCYPYPFRYKGNLYAFYNGNSYGQTGVGLAILDSIRGA